MELHENPFIKPTDYWAQYRENIEKLKNHPESLAFDKLCYELFHVNEQGKKFMEIVTDKFIIPALVERGTPNYHDSLIWCEGFKGFPLMLKQYVRTHLDRAKAEINK
jgi:hypothetical protein